MLRAEKKDCKKGQYHAISRQMSSAEVFADTLQLKAHMNEIYALFMHTSIYFLTPTVHGCYFKQTFNMYRDVT